MVLLFWLLSWATAGANAASKVNQTTVYYDIHGSTPEELRREMDAKRPVDSNEKHYAEATASRVRWTYSHRMSGGGCVIGDVETEATITYHLPNWVDSSGAVAELVNRWRQFIAALERHERGHGGFAADAALDVERAIAGLGSFATCDELELTVDETGFRILGRYAEFDAAYDRQTDHGRTQGAQFP